MSTSLKHWPLDIAYYSDINLMACLFSAYTMNLGSSAQLSNHLLLANWLILHQTPITR